MISPLTFSKRFALCITSNLKQHPHRLCASVTSTTSSKSTVDQSEVTQHSKNMKGWWDPDGPIKMLHRMNHIRVPFIRDGLVDLPPKDRTATPLKGVKILDVACGGGILSEALARLGAEVTGIDASPELIEVAQAHSSKDPIVKNNKPTYFCTPIEDHAPKYRNYYDGVVASEIIEHIDNENKELFLNSCVECLKPGGRIFITSPCRTRMAQIFLIHVAELFNIVPRGTHQYEKFSTPPEVTFILERNNCHVEMILGFNINLLNKTWYYTKDTTFLFGLRAVKGEE